MAVARVAFIGAGAFVSAHHLITARDSRIMEIRAIADLDEQVLDRHRSCMPVGYTTTDYRRVLADPQIDVIVIGTKQDIHAKLIVESLDAGKWVYCEKPMAETSDETNAVISAKQRNSCRLAIGFNRRFAPAYVEAKTLRKKVSGPWYLNYRLMIPHLPGKAGDYYEHREHILYEGTHILDLACWLLDAVPTRVYMTGDRYHNSCCVLDFADGSRASLMCGSLSSFCMGKERMELFADHRAITVDEFVDMRVRGFAGEYDRIFPPHLNEHADTVRRFGMDFFETYRVHRMRQNEELQAVARQIGFVTEEVRRPNDLSFDVTKYYPQHPDLWSFMPDKGWVQALEHFVECFLHGKTPQNADAFAGARSTNLALALLRSLDQASAVEFTDMEGATIEVAQADSCF